MKELGSRVAESQASGTVLVTFKKPVSYGYMLTPREELVTNAVEMVG